jgi:hemoglobin
VSTTGPEPVELGRQVNVHDAVGGEAFFAELVERFYEGVADDALLRPLYPEDLTDSRRHMVLFLRQYWGGPGTYSEERGHPRLRMRHAPFAIRAAERDAWLRHMLAALDATAAAHRAPPELVEPIRGHLRQAADFLVNTG